MSATFGLLARTDSGWGHMNGWGGGWMWMWGVAMMVLVGVLVVWLIRLGDRATHNSESRRMPRDPYERGREILAERFAKGELSSEEFQERVQQLK